MAVATTLSACVKLPCSVWAQAIGATDDVRVAIVGLRKRGKKLLEAFRAIPGVRVVARCDVDSSFLQRDAAEFKRGRVAVYRDYRKLLEADGTDAVVIATPNHWHALMTIWACQAGKDVYVEKPVSHNIWEGRKMVEAARKYNRIVQAGTQNRSDTGLQQAISHIQKGNLGKVLKVHGLDDTRRPGIGKVI